MILYKKTIQAAEQSWTFSGKKKKKRKKEKKKRW